MFRIGPGQSEAEASWFLPVRCAVDRRVLVFTKRLVNAPGAGEGGSGHNDTPIAQVVTPLEVGLKLYRTREFAVEVQTPLSGVPIGTLVYVELAADRAGMHGLQGGIVTGEPLFGDNPKLVLRSCVAMPYVDAPNNLHHWLIKDLVPVDDSTDILSSSKALRVRFKMQSFQIGGNKNVIIVCEPYLCLENDQSQNCASPSAQAQYN